MREKASELRVGVPLQRRWSALRAKGSVDASRAVPGARGHSLSAGAGAASAVAAAPLASEDPEPERVFKGHRDAVTSVAFCKPSLKQVSMAA